MRVIRYLVGLLTIPIWFTLFLGLLGATIYLHKLTGSPWALGLPVYLLPIWWWLTWRRIEKDFDPMSWNSLHDTKLGTFFISAAGPTIWTSLISATMLTADDGPFHWIVPAMLFAAFVILITYKSNLREKRRDSLAEQYQPNETALKFWHRTAFVGWLLAVAPAIFIDDDPLLSIPGFLLAAFSFLVLTYLDHYPKRLD